MPTEQMIRYFQAASSDPRVLREPTGTLVTMVVASTATQSTPGWREHGEEHGGDEPCTKMA